MDRRRSMARGRYGSGERTGEQVIQLALVDLNPDVSVTESSGAVSAIPNQGTGGSDYDVDTVVGTGANLKLHPSGSILLYGASGDYVSTGDTPANSILGDITLIAYVQPDDWTPSSTMDVISKDNTTGDNRSFRLIINADGTISLVLNTDGQLASNVTGTSTAATGFTNSTGHWIRATWDDSEDAVNFYTSNDAATTNPASVSWSQLGDADVALASAGIFDGTAPIEVGSRNGGNSVFTGKIYRAVGIASTDPTAAAAFDCNPTLHASDSDTTFSSGGVTWTLNGNTFIQNTGFDVVHSIGSAGLETSASQNITQALTVFAVARFSVSAPSANQFLLDSRTGGNRTGIESLDSLSDRFTIFAGSVITLDEAYDTDTHVFTALFNGASSTLTVSGLGTKSGDVGSSSMDFGSIFVAQDGSLPMPGYIARLLVFNYALNEVDLKLVKDSLRVKYGLTAE